MTPTRLTSLALAAATISVAVLLPISSAHASGFTIDLNDTVNSSTTIKSLNQTVTVPTGSFVGTVNGDTGKLTGTLKLPAATTTIKLAGIGLAKATIALAPTKAVTGSLDLSTMSIHATATLRIILRRLTPILLPVNLVGSSCETSVPATISFSGPIAATGDVSVSGTYTIPSFVHCGGLSAALDLAVSGSGNTFQASLIPVSS